MKIDAIWTAPVQQLLFRGLLDTMARPGTIWRNEALLEGRPAWLAVLATLLDGTVSIADLDGLMGDGALRLSEASVAGPGEARFILADGGREPDFEPALGDLENPELSATIVLRVASLGKGPARLRLKGPGIDERRELDVDGLSDGWIKARAQWCTQFPLGIDIVLADESGFAALPRTTRMEV